MAEGFSYSMYVKITVLSSYNDNKGQLLRIVLWMTLLLYGDQSSSTIFHIQFEATEEEIKFYQEGDFIIGGVLTISAATTNYTENNTVFLYCTE